MDWWWSWLLTGVGVTGLYFAGRKRALGWGIGIAAQVLWFIYAVATTQWGFIVSCLAYGAVYGKNFVAWRREARAPHDARTTLDVPDSPKMLRETLCVAQARIANSMLDVHRHDAHIDRLQRLIDECDRHRPLGPDGKHGERHTETCGCEL